MEKLNESFYMDPYFGYVDISDGLLLKRPNEALHFNNTNSITVNNSNFLILIKQIF